MKPMTAYVYKNSHILNAESGTYNYHAALEDKKCRITVM
jgi:hypothetical protein